jgi:flagellar hook protein FlgE
MEKCGMSSSFLTGVSGLRAHQTLLEVVGNNIANVNTTGFKAQRATFADLMYQTMRPASGPSEAVGGTNPYQIGLGVRLAQTDRTFTQGGLETTGKPYDLAINGGGFFVVNDGVSDFYTRAGDFNVDQSNYLVNSSGFRVARLPGVGEPDGVNPGFQIPGDAGIRIPIDASMPGMTTSSVTVTGNLNAALTPPLEEVMVSRVPFSTSTGPATGATLLNDLDSLISSYVAGDAIVVSGTDADGSDRNASLNVTAASTLQDLVDTINSTFTGFVADVTDGNLVLTANDTGPAQFSVILRDESGNAGQTNFALHEPRTLIDGKLADSQETQITVYDVRGGAHQVTLNFEKQTDDVWRLTASMPFADGVVIDNEVPNIEFHDDGTLRNTGDPNLVFQFDGIATPQTVQLSFASPTGSEQLRHREDSTTFQQQQDGLPPGILVSASVDHSGRVQGLASNGRTFTLAQLAIANFRNPEGLLAAGDTLFQTTPNSGDPEIGEAGAGSRGQIFGSHLESSNVDLAYEFTRLIVGQRGFSANARTITVADEVLEELTNLIR